ncbi:MAG TPA: copper amine oxidase N-terminal domain-containing protein, partial [Armatimonadota bacterium]
MATYDFHRCSRSFSLLLVLLLLQAVAGSDAIAGLYDAKIVNRPDKSAGFFVGSVSYNAYIVSNIPQEKVMRPVCGEALYRQGHCTYVPLATVGKSGRKQRDLLPYDEQKDSETILVVDRSALTAEEKASISKLLKELYPGVSLSTDATTVQAWVQNSGKNGQEYQVLIDLPSISALEATLNDLRQIPENRLMDKSKRSLSITHTISVTAILTNDDTSAKLLAAAMPFSQTTIYTLDQLTTYKEVLNVNSKICVFNWNGESQITAKMAAQVFSPELQSKCEQDTPDRLGITGWQRFCREAVASSSKSGEVTTWIISAPTSEFLRALTNEVIKSNFQAPSYRISLCDLSNMKTIAVGAYVQSKDADRKRLVMQQRLEEIAEGSLKSKVRSMVSTQNWGDILQEVMNSTPGSEDPFKSGEAVKRINQASKADAVLLLWVQEIHPQVKYNFPHTRLTDPYPPFTKEEPKAPRKPEPDDKPFLKGHTYPLRQNDPQYIADMANYNNTKMPAYRQSKERWEADKREWERGKQHYDVNYEFEIQSSPEVVMTGFLKIIDSVATQKVLWNCDVDMRCVGETKTLKTIPVRVTGDEVDPPQPREINQYHNAFSWGECATIVGGDTIYGLGQQTLFEGISKNISRLTATVLWQNDLKPWNLPTTANGSGRGGRGVIADTPAETGGITAPTTAKGNDPPPDATKSEPTPASVTDTAETEKTKMRKLATKNGVLMLPLRDFVTWLGTDRFTYDAKTMAFTIKAGETIVFLRMGSKEAFVNGTSVTMSAPASQMLRDGKETCAVPV